MITKRYIADFETTTDENDCRVWGWGVYSIGKDKVKIGTNIDSFFRVFFSLPKASKIYFHNLAFDGEFMLYYLLENGFKHSTERYPGHRQFTTLIDGMGTWYGMSIGYKGNTYHIYDSYKIIPLSVKAMPKAFGLDSIKGGIDYKKYRPVGYKPTKKERKYIYFDVKIVGQSLKILLEQDLKKITQASNAFEDFKTIIGKDNFKEYFPKLPTLIDKQLREAYKGGFTYVDPRYQDKEIGEGLVFDVNSLYPYVMKEKKLPYGEPLYFEGKYEPDDLYDLYIIRIRCSFELKSNHIPTIQLKNNLFFNSREYLSSSDDKLVILTMTSVDYELFKKQYDIYNLEIFGGFKFKSSNKIFSTYVDKWAEVKKQSTFSGNKGMRTISKLMLNALYGKFGLNPEVENKIPFLNDEGLVKYKKIKGDDRKPVYVSVASFVTAYAREITINGAQDNYERFIYADTDSLHLKGLEPPKGIKIDPVKLGYWDHEDTFTKGRFLRAKSYIEEIDGKTHVTCAGLPAKCHVDVSFDNFRPGLKVGGKLQTNRVKGGIVLKETDFTIKM